MQQIYPTLFPGDPVAVELLGDAHMDGPTGAISGAIVEIFGPQLRLMLNCAVPFGAAVKIEASETLFLGDVSHCEAQDGAFAAAITARHSLHMLSELRRLNEALLGYVERTPVSPPV